VKAAAEFPAKLFAVHGDKIQVRETAVYCGNGTKEASRKFGIDVICTICSCEWSPTANNLLKGQGCPDCGQRARSAAASASALVRKCPPATPEEKARAALLHSEGLTYAAIGQMLGRPGGTVRRWLNPQVAEKERTRSAERLLDPEARKRKYQSISRYRSLTDTGRSISRATCASRRLLHTNTPEYVFLDGTWQEVDRRETWRIFGQYLLPPAERKAIQELYLEAQYLTETTGIEHHVDHIQPLSKGGEHMMFNLQIITAEENLSKGGNFREEDQIELARRLFGC